MEATWGEDITLSFPEDNIERRGAENHIARLSPPKLGNDLADLGWKGDESLPPPLRTRTPTAGMDTTGLTQADHDFPRINNGWPATPKRTRAPTLSNATGASNPSPSLRPCPRAPPTEHLGRDLTSSFRPSSAMAYADELAARTSPWGTRPWLRASRSARLRLPRSASTPTAAEGNLPAGAPLMPDNLALASSAHHTLDAQHQPRRRAVEHTITAR